VSEKAVCWGVVLDPLSCKEGGGGSAASPLPNRPHRPGVGAAGPLIPHPSRVAAPPSTTAASWSTPCGTGCAPAAPGGCCPTTSPPGGPSTTAGASGASRAGGSRCSPGCASRHAAARAARPPQRGDPRQPTRPHHRKGGGAHGYDAKRLNGRKRHLLVDTLGLIGKAHVTSADTDDRDGAARLLGRLDRRRFPRLRHGWVDQGDRGRSSSGCGPRQGSRFSDTPLGAGPHVDPLHAPAEQRRVERGRPRQVAGVQLQVDRWGRGTWLVMVDPARRRNSSVPTAAQGFPLALVARERDRALVRRVRARGVAGPPQELGPHGV
jgi:hypothetical protein